MKAVLFSADFAIDSNDNPRLLELNTDTVVFAAFTSSLQLNNLTDVVNANSGITEFHVVYKPFIHGNIERMISSSVALNCPNITTYSTTEVDSNTSFPVVPLDADSKFILRMAYDENAVFDSTYTKNNVSLLKLMYDNNATSSIGEFYHSSSLGEINTLSGTKGSSDFLPDFVVKPSTQPSKPFQFYSIASSETDNETIINLAKELTTTSDYVEKYYYNSDQISSGKVKALRSYNIMYGPDLTVIGLGSGSYDAIFDFQTDTNFREINSSGLIKLDSKHFYEFTNKFPQNKNSDGVLGEELIEKVDGTFISASQAVIGSSIKSFYYNSLPDTDDMDVVDAWSIDGYTTPEGSFLRSASIISTGSSVVYDGGVHQLELNGSSDLLNVGINTRIMAYDSSSNKTSFVQATHIDPSRHYLINPVSSSLIPITENYFTVGNSPSRFYSINVEPDDIYFTKIGDLGIRTSATVHNFKQEP